MSGFDQSQLDAVLKKIGQEDLKILADQLIPALFADLEGLLPVAYQPIAQVVLAAAQPALQAAIAQQVAKIQL